MAAVFYLLNRDGVWVVVGGFLMAVFAQAVITLSHLAFGGREHHFVAILLVQVVTVCVLCLAAAAKNGDRMMS